MKMLILSQGLSKTPSKITHKNVISETKNYSRQTMASVNVLNKQPCSVRGVRFGDEGNYGEHF